MRVCLHGFHQSEVLQLPWYACVCVCVCEGVYVCEGVCEGVLAWLPPKRGVAAAVVRMCV